ncbi:hypothetical protein [Sphingorhabdus contaminans]|uniref:Barstar family protein n=1 Tax=Sphingorhabdus contaminans TaxID=1343899 RepID=A0A553WJZ3_9SPHN|nr:hypothetical protein [Sphingorhabdus contaminans]TSB04976.1 hypothetical protein FOM92_06185 [Sphingorhabdus contaminans]
MAYEYLDHPDFGGRVHFRRAASDDDPADYVGPETLAERGIVWAYLDATKVNEYEALNSLGRQLRTDNPPYEPHPPTGILGWYRFMDDLETLSQRESGMVIVVNNAANLFTDPRSWVFELITVWVLQLPGWQKRNHPCHLIFQMEQDPSVEAIYSRNA